ncbi:MAG: LytTR family transcriptional regulator [Atopobiaceae bacterium]|nr:LytTR family transcriptional regulator [Atopobiaceae bacterium]
MAAKNMRANTSSVDEYAKEAIRLSKDFVHHIWALDIDWCLNRTAPDIVWIGSQKDHYASSFVDFAEALKVPEVPMRSTVTDEAYTVAYVDETVCCVAGNFLVLTPPNSDKIYAHWHRCTFVWCRKGRRPLLVHMHLSSPVGYVEDGEGYPISAGTETYRYMRSLMKLGSSRKSVSLYDVDGTVHWVHPSQIIYLEANRKRTVVHCMTKDIVVPAVIRDAVEMVDNKIMRVHRSYAVNRDHVVELKAGRLLLDDGTSIAIPAKRIADVRAELTGH